MLAGWTMPAPKDHGTSWARILEVVRVTVRQKIAVAQMAVLVLAGAGLGAKWLTYNAHMQTLAVAYARDNNSACDTWDAFSGQPAPSGCSDAQDSSNETVRQASIDVQQQSASTAMHVDVWAAALIAAVLIAAGIIGQVAFR